MYHFLSDLTGPPASTSETNLGGSGGNSSQQNAEKKRGRGRPRKVEQIYHCPESEQGGTSVEDNETQGVSAVVIKCEPEDDDDDALEIKRRKFDVGDECDNGYVDENGLPEEGGEEANYDGSSDIVQSKRDRRKGAYSAVSGGDREVRRTGRTRKYNDDGGEESDEYIPVDNDDDSDVEMVGKKRGRPRKSTSSKKTSSAKQSTAKQSSVNQSSDNQSSVNQTAGTQSSAEENAIDPTKVVKCACCNEEMQFKDFCKHNLTKHNSLGWLEGDQPTDLFDEKSLMTLLKRVMKQLKRKTLTCDSCGVEKKSCLGFITHKRVCGKSAEERYSMQVACELCGRKMMPVSMKAHMSSHAKPKLDGIILETGRKRAAASKAKSKLTEYLNEDGTTRPIASVPGRKRLLFTPPKPKKAPGKFIGKWRSELLANNPAKCFNINCPFETDNVETMKEHFKVCEFAEETPRCYECLLCVFKCEDEISMREHISIIHPREEDAAEAADSGSDVDPKDIDDPGSEDYDSDEEDRRRMRARPFLMKSKRPCHRFLFLAKEDLGRASALDTFSPTLSWTLQYRMENDSPSLFHEYVSNEEDWQLIPPSGVDEYLPATKNSIHVSFGEPQNGIRFSLFDSSVVDDSSVMFIGGPVWASAWCPIPLDVSVMYNADVSQFLAVSCHKDMDQFHGIYSCYPGPSLIQIWDCGPLSNTESPMVPKFALAIVHDYGTVWKMEWCPSGAYGTSANGKLRRLGLLAVACSDGYVHIFSVCFPSELHAHIKLKQAPIYRCKPVLTLKPNSSELTQCTRLSWYRGKGHGVIAGGYCDGKVALWNLENYSSLLYNKEEREMYPYHTFQAHYSVVSALSLCPDGLYLMTGSRDCSVKFWDLEQTNSPITVTRKGLVTDGAWLSHWMCGMTTYDDAYLHEHSNATLIPIREFGFKPYPVLPQNSVAWCLSESAWLNSLVQGSLAGEVALNIAGQLFLGLDNEKFPTRKRLLVCFTELRELVQDAEGKETLGAEPSKPSPLKEGSKANDKAKDKSKAKSKDKNKDKNKDKDVEKDDEVEEIPAENSEGSSKVDLKPRDYKDTSEKYGINIKNYLDFKSDRVPAEVTQPMRQSNAMNQVHSEMYPITSINQVQWNPNLKSCLWLAVGHQCGLMRLVCLKYMHSTTLSRFYSKAETVLKRAQPSDD